MATYNFTRGN